MTLDLATAACEAAQLGGRIIEERFLKERTLEFKGGIDLVTDADKASETAILEYLRKNFPDHEVLAEESGLSGTRKASHRWLVDPLDGTTNYAHRVPHFCVSVAVESHDGLLAGAIYDPIKRELFAAARGQGATLNGAPIRTSEVTTIDRALLCTGFPYDVRERPEAPVGLFNRFILRAQGVRRMGSAALDLAYVACGRFDGFFEFGLKPWDIAAGALIGTEAGAQVTQIDGSPLELGKANVLAAAHGIGALLTREATAFLDEIGWKRP